MQPIVRWHCVAMGRVQGVNYRARVLEAAMRRGLVGRVENRPDGTVFIEAQGPADVLAEFLEDVSGPRGLSDAREVRRLREVPLSAELFDFEVR